MFNDIVALLLTQVGRDNFVKTFNKHLQITADELNVNITMSSLHTRALDFHISGGRYINPATHCFGNRNSFGIPTQMLRHSEIKFSVDALEVYGISADLIPKLGIAVSVGTLIGGAISITLGSSILGPIGLIIGAIASVVTSIMISKQELERAEQEARMGSELANMLAYTTQLNSIKQLIEEEVIRTVTLSEFTNAIDIKTIQESFSQNFGNRSINDDLRSINKYIEGLSNLSKIIDDKNKLSDYALHMRKELSKLKASPVSSMYEKLNFDKASAAELTDMTAKLAVLFHSPRDYRISDISTSKGKTYYLMYDDSIVKTGKYLDVSIPKGESACFGSLASTVYEHNYEYEDFAMFAKQSTHFKDELKGISVEGVATLSGYIGVSVVKPIMKPLQDLGVVSKFLDENVSIRLNKDSDLASEYIDSRNNKISVSNVIRSDSDKISVTLVDTPSYEVIDVISKRAKDYALHYNPLILQYLFDQNKGPNKILTGLDDVNNFAIGSDVRVKINNKYIIRYTAKVPKEIKLNNVFSCALSRREAIFYNSLKFQTVQEFRENFTEEKVLEHFSLKAEEVDISEIVSELNIRIYAGSLSAIMTTNGYAFFDTRVPVIMDPKGKFKIIFSPEDIEGVFTSNEKFHPDKCEISIIMKEKRFWRILE